MDVCAKDYAIAAKYYRLYERMENLKQELGNLQVLKRTVETLLEDITAFNKEIEDLQRRGKKIFIEGRPRIPKWRIHALYQIRWYLYAAMYKYFI